MITRAFEVFAQRAVAARVVESEFVALCTAEGLNDIELFDALARHIAQRYNNGTWSFDHADTAMNRLWAFLVSRVKGDGWELPKLFYTVYEAFDSGEFYHSDDDRSIDPEEKYTKSLIASILSQP